MNKRSNIFELTPVVVLFSLVSIIFLSFYFIQFDIWNDYLISPLQDISENLSASGTVAPETGNQTLIYGQGFQQVGGYADYIWLAIYIMFWGSCIGWAYMSRPQNYWGLFAGLFYALMIILFILSIFVTITNWYKDNFFLKIMPTAMTSLPMFSYWLDNIGVFTLIQVIICMLINVSNFNLNIFNRNKQTEIDGLNADQGEDMVRDDEVN